MSLYKSSSQNARRSSKLDAVKDEDSDEEGYIQVYVKPIERGSCRFILSLIGISCDDLNNHQKSAYGIAAIVGSACVYQIITSDLGLIFHRMCGFIVPTFSIVCVFYWLSFYLRKTWSTMSVYLLFVSCYLSETLALLFVRSSANTEQHVQHDSSDNLSDTLTQPASFPPETMFVLEPLVILCIMLSVSVASVFSSLETVHSAVVILTMSFVRFLACTSLTMLPAILRPYSAYTWAFCGILLSKYMETMFTAPLNNQQSQDGKIPVIKRRRSSSSSSQAFLAHKNNRRVSLPALAFHSQNAAASYDAAIIGEAHGLISDMLAETNLPPQVVSGLTAVSNLLKPAEPQGSGYKARVSPLVSLTESPNYGSDTEDSPYTGERPTTLPKRLRRSLPPSLIRRMSTSTWTTTTSATGMPTVEMEPCRLRSSSFRQQRTAENITPGSSPTASRSNSPSPSTPSTVTLTIPKARSLSVGPSSLVQPGSQKRPVRKSVCFVAQPEIAQLDDKQPSVRADSDDSAHKVTPKDIREKELHYTTPSKRFNITSDYESSDSPSSSDHSDNVATSDDMSVSPPKKSMNRIDGSALLNTQIQDSHKTESSKKLLKIDPSPMQDVTIATDMVDSKPQQPAEEPLLFDPAEVERTALLETKVLAEWDYPIFELADTAGSLVLSKLAYKVFSEVGLFDTFRIPIAPFLNYFHALEMGYRDIPYHNRIHAADVLHGVYYFTTQPVPGLQQVTHTDMVARHHVSSSNESECDRQVIFKTTCADDSYGIMGGNLPALELMALYTAAAMHDYDHPGRTNAFLVTTYSPKAILYNDRSVLENHHAAAAWHLFMSNPKNNFLVELDAAEFKRFRFIAIEAILATDLKRHFEILAEFNAKVNDDDAPGIDWTQETDRLLVSQMVIKLSDINGPAKRRDLHCNWTQRISEEFYEQGKEESDLGMPISPFMDRRNPQLAKLQESFINHLVSPLCNAMVTGGIVPGTWVEEDRDNDDSQMSDTDRGDNFGKDTEDDTDDQDMCGLDSNHKLFKKTRQIHCVLTKNMKENHEMWVQHMNEEQQQKAAATAAAAALDSGKLDNSDKHPDGRPFTTDKAEMAPIKEESENSPKSSPVKSS